MGVVVNAINWALSHTKAQGFTYVYGAKGPDSYDCSSFVTAAYKYGGGLSQLDGGTYTGTLKANFEAVGFVAIPYTTSTSLQAGDVLVVHIEGGNQHALMFLSSGEGTKVNCVEAVCTSMGIIQTDWRTREGLQTSGYQWIMRYPGAYGIYGETPSNYNRIITSGFSDMTEGGRVDVGSTDSAVSNVEWEATDNLGNGEYHTSQANFTPYIATPSWSWGKGWSSAEFNKYYTNLLDNGVSAMIFYGGKLYDKNDLDHKPRSQYANPYLDDQIYYCQQAELPYALYVTVRANTKKEAEEECKPLYYLISKYPPGLGLWLYIDINPKVAMDKRNAIIDYYYSKIVEWGLGAKCGFYVEREKIVFDKDVSGSEPLIQWDRYKNKFYLWMMDHINNKTLSGINKYVLTSDFFEVP